MKRKSRLNALAASLLSVFALTNASHGATLFGNGALTTLDPTFVNPGGSLAGTAIQYYDLVQFSVDTTGGYTVEVSSLNTHGAGQTSDALDTFLRLYADSFNPAAPGFGLAANDDFTGTLTVLPGPYTSDGLTSTATGFQSTQPSSRFLNINLTASTQYFLVLTSFRATDYLPGTEGGPTGNYWYGMSGTGNFTVVSPPSNPRLRIFRSNGNVVIAWPTNATGWTLHANTNLATANWPGVTNTASIVGAENQVTVAPTPRNRYFRLSKP